MSENTCKFCVVHEYGVYVLNATALLVASLVLVIYWKSIVAYCTGTSKPILARTNSGITPNESGPRSPMAPVIYPSPFYMTPTLTGPPIPPQLQPQSPPTPPYNFTPQAIQNFPQSSKAVDPFKLPTKHLKSHESTGSVYLKQMMRGKKPVKSISQYKLLKNHNTKKHKDDPKKRKKHHKEKKVSEKKKFENDAKLLAKGLP